MAKRSKTTKAAATSRNTTSPAGRRSTRRSHAGAASGTNVPDVIGADVPRRARMVSSPQRPNETELAKLQREHEQALSTGQAQPHPTMAPRAARTAPDSGPLGRAHQPLRVPEGNSKGKDGIRVRATRLGYYAERRRRPGDVFVLTEREGFKSVPVLNKDGSPKMTRNNRPIRKRERGILSPEEQLGDWMEVVGDETPLRESTSADVMPKGAKQKARIADEDTI